MSRPYPGITTSDTGLMHVGDVCDALLFYIYSIAASRCHFLLNSSEQLLTSPLKGENIVRADSFYASAIAEHLTSTADLALSRLGYLTSITFNRLSAVRFARTGAGSRNDIRRPKPIIAYVSVTHSRGKYAGEGSHLAAVFLVFRRERTYCGEGIPWYAFRLFGRQSKISLRRFLPQRH
jgi:hypothetical protein